MDEIALTLRLSLAVLLAIAQAATGFAPLPHLRSAGVWRRNGSKRNASLASAFKPMALVLALFLVSGLFTSWAAAVMTTLCCFAIFVQPLSAGPAASRTVNFGLVGAAASLALCALGPGLYSADAFLGFGPGPAHPLFALTATTLALLAVSPFTIARSAATRTVADSEAAVSHFLPH